MQHISNMSLCDKVGDVKAGEAWTLQATYDLEEHKPMLEQDGKLSPVMGISMLYVMEGKEPRSSS